MGRGGGGVVQRMEWAVRRRTFLRRTIPKLQFYFADFPYLLSPASAELAKLGHLMRLSVRRLLSCKLIERFDFHGKTAQHLMKAENCLHYSGVRGSGPV